MDPVRLEEYTGLIQNKLVAVWQGPNAITPWLPTEFLLSQYITRILVTGRQSPMSTAMAADGSWTQIWRSPGSKEWSCLLGIIQHMPGPVLLVIGPDIALSPKIVANLKTDGLTTLVLRQSQGFPQGTVIDQVFFPIVDSGSTVIAAIQEWSGKAAPKTLDLRTVIPQLTAQGYGLTVADGVWQWYKPADSPPLVTLTVQQIARQLQVLGELLASSSA
jgi:hypothetical protein